MISEFKSIYISRRSRDSTSSQRRKVVYTTCTNSIKEMITSSNSMDVNEMKIEWNILQRNIVFGRMTGLELRKVIKKW